jgi:ferrochelatase
MKTGIILLNFGEPERPTEDEVVPFLERIFATNAALEGDVSPEQARARTRELARRRAPGLIEEYRTIGGSPLNAQARAQTVALRRELGRRGHDAFTYMATQFSEPSIPAVVEQARADRVDRVVALPVYPLAGPSTTVAALAALADAIRQSGWPVPLCEVSGWHTHPLYIQLRAEGIRRLADQHSLDLAGRDVLVFSAHGTPLEYLRGGSRYELYVHDCCRAVAAAAGVARYVIGYQNHSNRPVEWTQPDIHAAVRAIDADRIVVVPISFMHEQSETLVELDLELREVAEHAGMRFHRVPVPHDDPRFTTVLADLVERRLAGDMLQCRCRIAPETRCLTAAVARGADG